MPVANGVTRASRLTSKPVNAITDKSRPQPEQAANENLRSRQGLVARPGKKHMRFR